MTIHLHCYKYKCADAKRHYRAAKLYLSRSKMARMIIEGLESSKYDVLICVSKHTENVFRSNDVGPDFVPGGYIVWDPENSITVINRSNNFFLEHISSALALLHEMSHAYQTISEPRGYVEAKGLPDEARAKSQKRSRKSAMNMVHQAKQQKLERLEQTVVDAIEHTVARELNAGYGVGVEGKRVRYGDTFTPKDTGLVYDLDLRTQEMQKVLRDYLLRTPPVLPDARPCH